jgi:hypothetical protein
METRRQDAGSSRPVRGEPDWATFTRRTNDPKLTWLEQALDSAGIPHRRQGESWHAPILQVPKADLDRAWTILDPVDEVADDDPMFGGAR